jgi:hypothetical protein
MASAAVRFGKWGILWDLDNESEPALALLLDA